MLRTLLAALALTALSAMTRGAIAGDPPAATEDALKREVDRLLTDVASDKYEVREAARKRLSGIARQAKAALEARREDPDPEIRRTVRTLLEGLGQPEPTASAAPAAELLALGLVTFSADGPLSDAMKAWDEKCGGRLRLAPSIAASPVKIDVAARPYFEVLDAILGSAKAEIGDGFDEAGEGAAVSRESPPAVAPAYSGAFRLDLDSVNATRSFRQGPARRYSLTLRAMWSPDVQVVSYSPPTLVKATDAAGKAFRATDYGNVLYGAPGRRSTSMQLVLDPEDDTVGDRVASLEAKVRFRIRYGRQEARFSEPAKAQFPAVVEVASRGPEKSRATKVTLESFGPDPDRRGWAMGTVTVALAKGVSGDSVTGILETADGLLRPMYDLASRITGSDGVLHMTVRAPGATEENPAASFRIVWTTREDDTVATFVLKDVPLR